MTTFEPGARLAFTQCLVFNPFSTAFLASRPAATITDGFEVFVQLVIAAITTEPWVISAGCSVVSSGSGVAMPIAVPPPSDANRSMTGNDAAIATFLVGRADCSSLRAASNAFLASCSGTRSWGRLGPARLGSTVARSSSSVSE